MKAAWLSDFAREAFVDFHNGAVARDMMANFDAVKYVDMLVKANVNRHTSFVKCHHGYAYYPTAVGAPHPHLKGDLFGQIATECHRRGIAVMAYYNVTRDGVAFDENPDWRQTKRDGSFLVNRHIKHVCVNSPYTTERLWPMVDEVINGYPFIRGFFFDATVFMPGACFCEYCKRKMQAEGVNENNDAAAAEFHARSLREFIDATTARIAARIPDPAIYYNSPDFVGKASAQDGQIYMIIESLPSGWGFERTSFFGRYYRASGKHVCAQTGRFHKAWADFGGLKPDAALRYDAALALSLGASFGIGDQGNPDGTLEPAVYEAEGKAFAYYAEREEWARGSRSVPHVALLCRKQRDSRTAKASDASNYGLLNALVEEQVHFDPIDIDAELAPYAAIVVEDFAPPDEAAARKLAAYVKAGGRLLTLGGAVFTGAGRAAIEEALGVQYAGASPYTANYIRTPDGDLGTRLPKMDWVTYGPAVHLRPTTAQAIVTLVYPFTEAKPFRTVSHMYGHPGQVAPFPAATVGKFGKGPTATVATPLGALYYQHSYPPLRVLLKNLLDRLITPDGRALEVAAPRSVEVALMRQQGRLIVHLLSFHANRGSRSITVLEEIQPTLDVTVRVRMKADPKRVYLAPQRKELPLKREGNHVVVRLARFDLHAMIVLEER